MARIITTILLALAVSGCALGRSNTAEQARTDLVGYSKEQILACMGAPTAEKTAGATEVWSYAAGGGAVAVTTGTSNLSGTTSYGTAVTPIASFNCTANIVFSEDAVSSVSYTGNTGNLYSPYGACYQLIQNCVP